MKVYSEEEKKDQNKAGAAGAGQDQSTASSAGNERPKKERKKKDRKKKKAWPKVLIIVALILGVIVWGISSCTKKMTDAMSMLTNEVTAQAYGTHDTSVYSDSQGVIHSKNVQTVAQEAGGKITSVYVEKGDRVKKGDLLIAFDSSDIDDQIKQLEAQATDSERQEAKQMEIQRRNLETTKNSVNSEISSAAKSLENARREYNDANDLYVKTLADRDAAKESYEAALNVLALAEANVKAAEEAASTTEKPDMEASTEAVQLPPELSDLLDPSQLPGNTEATEKEDTSEEEAANIDELKKDVERAEKKVEEAKKLYESMEALLADGSMLKGVNAAKQAYESAQDMYNKTVDSGESSIQGQRDQIELQEIANSSFSTVSTQLAKLYEQKAQCQVKALYDGIVTVKNCEEGTMGSGVLLQIEDDSNLTVTLQIKEKDIIKVQEGAEVSFRSSTLEGAEAKGKVVAVHRFIAESSGMSANSALGSTGGVSSANTSTYEVVADVTEGAENLLLGMEIKAKITILAGESVYAVPYTSIVTPDDNSNSYVYVATPLQVNTPGVSSEAMAESGFYSISKVDVLPGQEGEYYTEIKSSSLNPGDLIVTTAESVSEGQTTMVSIVAPDED